MKTISKKPNSMFFVTIQIIILMNLFAISAFAESDIPSFEESSSGSDSQLDPLIDFYTEEKTPDKLVAALRKDHLEITKVLEKTESVFNLWGSVCYDASVALKKYLEENKLKYGRLQIDLVSTVLRDEKHTWADSDHHYLLIRDYYSEGQHLYIDPTFQQFNDGEKARYKMKDDTVVNYVWPKIFIGPKDTLKKFFEKNVNTNSYKDFLGDYFNAENHEVWKEKQNNRQQ